MEDYENESLVRSVIFDWDHKITGVMPIKKIYYDHAKRIVSKIGKYKTPDRRPRFYHFTGHGPYGNVSSINVAARAVMDMRMQHESEDNISAYVEACLIEVSEAVFVYQDERHARQRKEDDRYRHL